MKYLGEADYQHGSPSRVGVLVTNLGTPDAPTPRALRRYLSQFLWDPRVVEVPRPVWWLILHGVILNIRPRRSARKYASIWTNEGSPLLVTAQRQAEGIRKRLAKLEAQPIPVAVGMRYGNPSIPDALNELRQQGARQLVVLPLYPQYSASTTASTLDAVAEELQGWRWTPDLHFISGYERAAGYINALAASVQEHRDQNGGAERLIMSFHGVPKRYLMAGDPYHCFCHATGFALAQALGLEQGQWQVTFQSRFGRAEWLRPYTDETLEAMPAQGVKRVDVICPGFSSDCLETLEEIGDENREIFLNAGGEHFSYIPALNDRPDHLDFLTSLVLRHARPWLDALASDAETLEQARARALAIGAAH